MSSTKLFDKNGEIEMAKEKMMAAFAAMMMVVTGLVIVGIADDSAADNETKTVNVYFDGSGTWECTSYDVFNVFEAIQAASGIANMGILYTSNETDWTETSQYNGTYPNPDYGTISSIRYIYYDDDLEEEVIVVPASHTIWGCNSDGNWVNITNYALGWIRPFTDYAAYAEFIYNGNVVVGASAFANVAIQMNGTALTAIDSTSLRALTNPADRGDCEYTFIIKDTTGKLANAFGQSTYYGRQTSASANATQLDMDDLQTTAGITVYGYGSDAFLALIHATNGATFGQQETWIYNSQYGYYTNYSWMEYMFGIGTTSSPREGGGMIYDYWASYNENHEYTSFNLGYHTCVPGYYTHAFSSDYTYSCTGSTFYLEYTES